jgi:hypothetical protein
MKKQNFIKHFKIIISYFIILLVLPTLAHSQSIQKTTDFSSSVRDVKQKCDYWCVYACMEATITGKIQCDWCGDYITDKIKSFYNNQQNPYSSILTDTLFNQAMSNYVNNVKTPCNDYYAFEKFGVLSNHLNSYFPEFVGPESFKRKISDPNESSFYKPVYCISLGNGTGHCVVLIKSIIYNNDLDHQYSIIYYMDPYYGGLKSMKASYFFSEYSEYYQ